MTQHQVEHRVGGILLIQAIVDETERANLVGDIPGLFVVAIVLWVLMPKKSKNII